MNNKQIESVKNDIVSRPIKFRGWTGKEMFYQDTQYLASFIRRLCAMICGSEHESYLDGNKDIGRNLQQFTELNDKNGKEIYEGDIVKYTDFYEDSDEEEKKLMDAIYMGPSNKLKYHGQTAVVEMWAASWTIQLQDEGCEQKTPWSMGKFAPAELEVIGNIFENPELLT